MGGSFNAQRPDALMLHAMGGMLWWGVHNLNQWFARSALHRGAWLAFWILLAMLVYFAVLFLSGFRVRHLRSRVSERGMG